MPYLRQCGPPALVDTLPPMDETIWLEGSGAKNHPRSCTARVSQRLISPGWTVAARDDGHALAATEAHDRHDLGGALGQGDDVGRALVEGVHVAFVDESPFRGGDEAVRAEDPPELVEETGT